MGFTRKLERKRAKFIDHIQAHLPKQDFICSGCEMRLTEDAWYNKKWGIYKGASVCVPCMIKRYAAENSVSTKENTVPERKCYVSSVSTKEKD